MYLAIRGGKGIQITKMKNLTNIDLDTKIGVYEELKSKQAIHETRRLSSSPISHHMKNTTEEDNALNQ